MSSNDYIIKCSIAPPGVVYIKEKSIDNEFTIEFEKVPVKYAKQYFKNWGQETILMEADKASAGIYVRLSLGEGINDLCTLQQASNMTFTTLVGAGWTMSWSDTNECFIVTPPANFEFPDTYRASFRSSEFYTSAKEGTTTLTAYLVNFPDVETKIAPVNLYKRYPVEIEYFKASPETVAIGAETTLSWRVLNAQKCYITSIGQVETEGSRKVIIEEPITFELSAENDMGMTERATAGVGCEKPTIKLWSDSQFYHKGNPITLYWESTSATFVQITPSIGRVEASGQRTIIPESDTYTAIANGYDGFKAYPAMTSLYLKPTAWENVGQIEGVDLTKDTLNVDRRVWAYGGACYLFCDKTLYKSADLLKWEKVSELELETDMTLNAYSTTIVETTFIVMGITKKDSNFIQVAFYDFNEEKWLISEAMPGTNNVGGKLTNMGEQPIYGRQGGRMVVFFSPEKLMDDKWNLKLYYEDEKMDAFDITSLRDYLYLAVHQKNNNKVAVKSIEWKDDKWRQLDTTSQEVSNWFSFIPTKGIIYLLTRDTMIDISDFKSVSPFQPPLEDNYRPWTGSMNNSPFLITKESALWCYKE